MNKRISALTELTLRGEMLVQTVATEFDRMDLLMSDCERDVKRICEYMLNQQPLITEHSAFTGFFRFDGSIPGDVFNRSGHTKTKAFLNEFYCKHIDNLSSMDWQHGTSDYKRVLSVGVVGIIEDIDRSLERHTDPEKIEFLRGLRKIAEALIEWIKKCSREALSRAEKYEGAETKSNLKGLSAALSNIAENPPRDFYEAVLTVYVCFSMNPDSFGTLDRYLSEFYFNDIKSGRLTREEAKIYLQELFLMVQAATRPTSPNFTKGGQSHFCVGGRDAEGEDCFNELSMLIIESLAELPTYIPQVTLRWTGDTPKETLRRVLLFERNDPNKRIAFTNDDKRLDAYTKICGIPYSEAVNYTLVGCNEPAMLGGMCASTSHGNLAHAIEKTLHEDSDRVIAAKDFDEFYSIFKERLYSDLDRIYYLDDQYNLQRAKDVNYVSCLFLNGCIESGTSITRGGVNYAVSTIMFLGNVTTIDCLSIIRQLVFEEKILSMSELIEALRADWQGYEDLRTAILKKGDFFGNDEENSNYVARRYYDDLYEYVKNKRTVFGYPVLLGDHTGYPLHFMWFGQSTLATPDGRRAGEPLSYGISQTNGKARNGLTALMNSISKFDPHGISSATVTNFSLDESYYKDDTSFERTVDLLESYFRNGGMQFQLNHLCCDDLIAAKAEPEKFRDLRVRVTGYSDFFINLNEAVQDSVIKRYTE